MISYPRVKELLDYDPEEGVFRWGVSRGFKKRGTKASNGRITIEGRVYQAGRLAWFYVYGRWPGRNFCYRNGDNTDIRLTNLKNNKTYKRKGGKKLEPVRILTKGSRFHVTYFPPGGGIVDLGAYKDHRVAKRVKELCSE